jgi:NAD-dependent dihydropyrimidine dehydrogenase PreA subunit
MESFLLRNQDLFKFYNCISREFELYIPAALKSKRKIKCEYGFELPCQDFVLERYLPIETETPIFNPYRCVEPVRALFTYARESLGTYFRTGEIEYGQSRPLAASGVKNCDLFALKIQDFVFLEGSVSDVNYQKKRDSALIISGDCSDFKEVCFCRAFDINPYAGEGFDFNLSVINEGYIVDVASDKARKILALLKEIFSPVTTEHLSQRTRKRETVIENLEKHLSYHQIPAKETLKDIVTAAYDSEVFPQQALTCVECGGCVFICDTCHCFLLSDEKSGDTAQRMRLWDGCLYKNFSRVAGGANPLRMRYMRLRNRYLKKFDFFIENIGFQACCGCGRCIEVCPGKIDIRHVLRKLYEEKHLSTH